MSIGSLKKIRKILKVLKFQYFPPKIRPRKCRFKRLLFKIGIIAPIKNGIKKEPRRNCRGLSVHLLNIAYWFDSIIHSITRGAFIIAQWYHIPNHCYAFFSLPFLSNVRNLTFSFAVPPYVFMPFALAIFLRYSKLEFTPISFKPSTSDNLFAEHFL